jgi:hypothetical protein
MRLGIDCGSLRAPGDRCQSSQNLEGRCEDLYSFLGFQPRSDRVQILGELAMSTMGTEGFEPPTVNPNQGSGLEDSCYAGAAKSGAVFADSSPIDPDLAKIIDAWPNLPEAIRAGILAMVRAAGG